MLDFVGNNRAEFRLDLRYRALTGATRKGLERDVDRGFPFLPSGCQIVLDEVTQASVLASVRQHLTMRWNMLIRELRAHPTDSLAQFLDDSGAELPQVVRADRSWTTLRRQAGTLGEAPEGEGSLLRRVRALTHVDDLPRARAYGQLLSGARPFDSADPFARMLYFTLWPGGGEHADLNDGWRALADYSEVREEMGLIIELAFANSRRLTRPDDELEWLPLALHGSYQREEILAALGHAELTRPPSQFREGVLKTTREWANSRRAVHHAEQVGGRILTKHDVPGLPDQPDAVPLGIAIDHIGRPRRRGSATSAGAAPCCSSFAGTAGTSSAPRRTRTSEPPATCRTQVTGPSPSLGS